jgi:chromosome segregation ATPase
VVRAENQRLHIDLGNLQIELGNLQAEKEEIAQIKKQLKEAAAELHREERSLELEKVRWQRELSDAKSELKDAQATILAQRNKIRDLERGYGFKPTPTEKILRREIGELQTQLSALKQKLVTASKDFPDAADLLNQLKAKRKKTSASLADVEKILEILESTNEE